MRIKRIEIHGFKSFADKTEIDLGAGLTAVVGPNGSGKSNLAEAVKWVLGEQSARILRGQRMDDIIFSGTARRKGVSYAEVSLVFDNDEKRLPLEYSEVVITRRAYRSGEGEYLINRKACRLRDITELFLDTGVGKDSYSFVGQGRIEEILNADPRQRRGIFEEAAGISRYKLRKKETESRLDEVHANLRRVSDIEAELQMQLAPLEGEAEKATVYLQLQSTREIWGKELLLYELGLAERQVVSIRTQIEKTSDERLGRESQLSILEAERSEFAMRQSTLISEITGLEAELRMVGHDRAQLSERLTELEAELPAANEAADRLRGAIVDTQTKVASLEADRKAKVLELESAEADLRQCQAALALAAENLAGTEIEAEYTELAGQRATSIEVVASLKAEIESLQRSLTRTAESKAQAESELQGMIDRLTVAEAEKEVALKRQGKLTEVLTRLRDERDQLLVSIMTAKSSRNTEEEKSRALESDLFGLQRKLDNLRRAEEQFEGLTRAAKHILELKLPGVRGALARLIEVPPAYARAIEMSLGAALSDVVVQNEATAKRAIAELKEHKVGRATFYPLDIFRSRSPRSVPASLSGTPGYFGRASELVTCPEFAMPVVDHLLQNVLVVADLDTAGAVAAKTGYGFRIMTVEGDMMLPGGSMSGGSLPARTGSLLSRQQEIESVEREISQAEADLAASRLRLSGLAEQLELFNKELGALDIRLDELHTETVSLSGSVSSISGECDFMEKSRGVLQTRLQQSLAELVRSGAAVESLQSDLKAAIMRQDGLDSGLARLKNAMEQQMRLRQEEAERQRELELKQARAAAQRELLTHVCGEMKRDLHQTRLQQDDLQLRFSEAEGRKSALKKQIETIHARLSELEAKKEGLKERLEQSQASREALQKKERDNVAEIAACREALEAGRSRLHALEIRQVRVEGELESLTDRFAHDYPGEGLRNSTLANRSEAETQINDLDRQISDLGEVRVSSIGECRRLQDRLSFLASERDDLSLASGKLLQAISELDKIMAARFVESFAVVQREFVQVAERLFAGGAARVSMVDPSSPLETGIEIDVQPPGKRLQNIRLLSGGERALAAVSLLCAVLRVKPTPFCVLDEVDAALDDANVERLIPVLRELSTHTQFLLVTHTKSTMLAADILYGVTMPEQGVSKVLSVRVSDVSAQDQREA